MRLQLLSFGRESAKCAFVAIEAAVLPSTLQIVVAGKSMMPGDYVLSIPGSHFQAESVVMNMEFPKDVIQPEIAELKQPIQTDEGSLFHPGVVRFTVRNPKWGTVRSCAVSKDVCIGDVISRLLPNFMSLARPVLCCNENPVDPVVKVGDLPDGECCIHLSTAKPWPVAEVVITRCSVKSAFHCKEPVPEICRRMRHFCMLSQNPKNDFTIMTLLNGKSVDPRLQVGQNEGQPTLEFRVCALPGGAKNNHKTNEANAKKLRPILAQRGILEEALAARAALIVGAIDRTELSTILTKDDGMAWDELKTKANQAKLRPITNAELKDHQKLQRKKAADGMLQKKGSDRARANQTFASKGEPLKKAFIDPKHFSCPMGKIGIIELHQWGPNQCGIAIATTAEATKLLPVTKISPDPLALVILDQRTICRTNADCLACH